MTDIPVRKVTVEIDGKAIEVRICNEPGCVGIHLAKGMCHRHYRTAQTRRRRAAIRAQLTQAG